MRAENKLVDTVLLTGGHVLVFVDGDVRISSMFPNSEKVGTVYLSSEDADKLGAALLKRPRKTKP